MGYYRAGFDVVGVDIEPQPRYPFPFLQGDVLEVLKTLLAGGHLCFTGEHQYALNDFSAIHASPPCQRRTKAQKIQKREHPALIGPTRFLLERTGLNYVIENVVPDDAATDDDPLVDPVMLCGAMFGLKTYRHRLFESNVSLGAPPHPTHVARTAKMGRPPQPGEFMHVVGNFSGVEHGREVMGMPWASRDGLREAIPPVYAQWVGGWLLNPLNDTKEMAA